MKHKPAKYILYRQDGLEVGRHILIVNALRWATADNLNVYDIEQKCFIDKHLGEPVAELLEVS